MAYELLKFATTITRNMPKDFKASIGGEIRSLCVQSVILIARANAAQDKAPHLTTLLEHIHAAEILFRLSKDMRFISTGQYATWPTSSSASTRMCYASRSPPA